MKNGVFDDISNSEYHNGEGVSKSGLDLMAVSPLHFRARHEAANDDVPTAAQFFGTAFHTLILEPEKFDAEFVLPYVPPADALNTSDDIKARLKEHGLPVSGTKPELMKRLREVEPDVKSVDELKQQFAVTHAGKTILDPKDWERLQNMRDAVMAHPTARALFKAPGKAERSVYWTDEVTGELCRCRPDYWTESNIVVDLKSCTDASLDGFTKSIADWRYHVQQPFYCDGIEAATGVAPKAFLFVAVEKTARVVDGQALGVGVYRLDDESVALGRAEYRETLEVYAECRKSGKWPGYGDKVQAISLPAWVMNRGAHKLAS